jgi:hypothetical protein
MDKCYVWEDRPYAHRVAMGRGNSAEEGESNWATLVDIDCYCKLTTISPGCDRWSRNFWLDTAIYQIRWVVDLDTIFLWMHVVFRITSTD